MRTTLPSTRRVIPEDERRGFWFPHPEKKSSYGEAPGFYKEYADWERYHEALGQELAKRIRRET